LLNDGKRGGDGGCNSIGGKRVDVPGNCCAEVDRVGVLGTGICCSEMDRRVGVLETEFENPNLTLLPISLVEF